MSVVPRPFPPALPHGPLREVLPTVHVVTGTVGLPGPLPVRFSRNMAVLKEGGRLVLVNTVRLDDAGLRALDALGEVTDVIRIAGNHGSDDPFYADRYRAKVWAVAGQRYTAGFDTDAPDTYFTADEEIGESTKLPIEGARVYRMASSPPEGLLVLERSGTTVIAGDCFQNWAAPDEQFSFVAKIMMRMMGFVRPHNVGPAWFKRCKPPLEELRGTLDLGFDNVIPAHGAVVVGGALEKFRPIVERLTTPRG